MHIIYKKPYERRKKAIEEFSQKCPYRGKECAEPTWDDVYIVTSHCDQCYDENKYNTNNGRECNYKIIDDLIESHKYKYELTKNCKYAKEDNTCNMKDLFIMCKYCDKKFSR